jgi:hypothetical protein
MDSEDGMLILLIIIVVLMPVSMLVFALGGL